MRIQRLQQHQYEEAAKLIHLSLDTYYRTRLNSDKFGTDWKPFQIFTEIYEEVDPGCCVTIMGDDGTLQGCAFYHPRETHVGVGIVATHPFAGGKGLARTMMQEILRIAKGKPLRLVSSAMNLDSFSLYTKLGFVPHTTFQDVTLHVPETGLSGESNNVRPATEADLQEIADLEFRLQGIRREHDYRFFLRNPSDHWRLAVVEGNDGKISGFLAACVHPSANMLGPGVFSDESSGQELIHWMLDRHFRNRSALWLLPVQFSQLVRQAYAWGARNVETHLASTLGPSPKQSGISIPTFMPESG